MKYQKTQEDSNENLRRCEWLPNSHQIAYASRTLIHNGADF